MWPNKNVIQMCRRGLKFRLTRRVSLSLKIQRLIPNIKVGPSRHFFLRLIFTLVKMVKLTASDGKEIIVPKEVAIQSTLIKNMIEDIGDTEQPIPLPNVSGPVLEKGLYFAIRRIVRRQDKSTTHSNQSQWSLMPHTTRAIHLPSRTRTQGSRRPSKTSATGTKNS